MKTILTAVAVTAISAFAAVGAQAAEITFNLGGSTGQAPSYNYSAGGVDLTVTAGSFTSGSTGSETFSTGGNLNRSGSSLGVQNSGPDSTDVDGSTVNDAMSFLFSQAVTLVSINFSSYDSNDEFSYFRDTDSDGLLNLLGTNFDGDPYAFPAAAPILLAGIGAWDTDDDFRVRSITVSYDVSDVPLPAALPLFGAGIAAMGFVGKRKRRKAAAKA